MLTFHTTRFSPTPLNHGESVALTLAVVFVPGSFLSRERLNTRSPIRALSSISTFAAGSAHSLLLRKMDPSEYLSPSSEYLPPSPAHAAAAPSPAYPAAAPSPAYAAAALPPAYAAAPPAGPSVFVLSPLPGNIYEADRYFYSPDANVMEGDYAALLTFAGRYGYALAIYQCPDLAAFQASYPTAIVRPFAEVPAPFIARGHELMLFTAASAAPSCAVRDLHPLFSLILLLKNPPKALITQDKRILPRSRLQNHLPSLSPVLLYSLPLTVALILKELMVPLLSSEWGDPGV